jgi:aryl-alcohol dehydrogenase-like predicted oxidoreductase
MAAAGLIVPAHAQPSALLRRNIPSSGEEIPLVGLGTARRYEAPEPGQRETLARFGTLGGTVIDTAPVYGEAETVVGDLLAQLAIRDKLFLAIQAAAHPQDRAHRGPPSARYHRPSAHAARAQEGRPHPLCRHHHLVRASWPQFFLKYIVSHPAVTCAVPGMARPGYVDDNLGAARGRLPDAALRRRMEAFIDAI